MRILAWTAAFFLAWGVTGCATSGPKPLLAKEKRALWQEYQYKDVSEKEKSGDLKGAVEILRRVQASDPKQVDPYLDLLRLLVELRWYPQAEDVIELAESYEIEDPRFPPYKALVLIRTDRAAEALQVLEEAVESRFIPARYIAGISACENLEDKAGVRRWAEEGVRLAPTEELLRVLAGLEWGDGKPDLALALYEKALKLKPGDPNLLEAAALCAFELKDWERVLASLVPLKSITDLRPALWWRLGTAYRRTSQTDLALQAYYEAIDGGVLEAWLDVGAINLDRQSYREAEQSFAFALRHQPRNATAAYGQARALLAQQRVSEAQALLESFPELGSSYLLLCALGDARWMSGDAPGAREAYSRAMGLKPDAAYPQKALASLDATKP